MLECDVKGLRCTGYVAGLVGVEQEIYNFGSVVSYNTNDFYDCVT
jgi:hypothetical protein